MQNAKIQKLVENAEIENYMRHFLVIFKQCASLYLSKYAWAKNLKMKKLKSGTTTKYVKWKKKSRSRRKMWNCLKATIWYFLAFTMRSKLSRVSCSLSPMSPVYYGFMLKRAALKISQDFARRMRHRHDGLSTRSKITGLESKFFPISPTLITKVFGVKLKKSNL